MKLEKKLPFKNEYFEVVTMLAVLEHLDYPFEIASEIFRVLQPNGRLIITVPSKYSKPVLEFMAFKLKIISYDEIKDHKKYFNKLDIYELFQSVGFRIETHKYFQLGMNNFCVCIKKAA
jgi:2-polyprenyl-3-methyl-5-hydroxy-6-metoxy-1,4-benzoquinol methylase